MVCRINTGAKPSGAVLYNEDKVAHGEARFLAAVNSASFSREQLLVHHKINVLERYAAVNTKVKKPTFHAALSFHPSEQLSDEKLREISQQYMEGLGYGQQPYLVYRHEDTHHPHIHIVSVSVDYDGKRISDSHQYRRSNTIRQNLEKEHGLVVAEKQGKAVLMDGLLPEQVLSYKEPEAKKAIGNVVQTAMKDYRFSGIDTFSAFLHQHRVQLNQLSGVGGDGKPYRGISFQLTDGSTDKRGQAIGPAIKASRFAFAPTMERLEQRFKQSRNQSKAGADATRKRIDSALRGFDKISEVDFKAQLRSEGVQVLAQSNRFIYVDHKSRNVYADSELGEQYRREGMSKTFVEQSQRRRSRTGGDAAFRPVDTTVDPVDQKPAVTTVPVVATTTVPASKTTTSPGKTTQSEPKPTPQMPTTETEPKGVVEKAQPRVLTAEEEKALSRQVSQAYQKVRTEGIAGQPAAYFESQLITRFPYQHLTDSLVNQGVALDDARKAVTNFETYKQSQLPDIRAKEQTYFEQTTDLLVKLAQKMPIAPGSRVAFLASMELSLVGFNIRHRQHDDLWYPLKEAQFVSLTDGGEGQAVAFPQKASKHQRSLYIAIAGDQPAPTSVSYYQVSAYHLRTSVGEEIFQRVAPSLNANYLTQVSEHLNKTDSKPTTTTPNQSLLLQLASRGIIVEKGTDGRIRAGHVLSERSTFAELDTTLAKRVGAAFLPPLSVQRSAQQTPGVRQLVSLTQAIDQGQSERVRQLTNLPGNQPGASAQVLSGLQASLGKLYTAPATQPDVRVKPVTNAPRVDAPRRSTATVDAPRAVPTSAYGEAVVAMLLKTTLSPQERGAVATQLGLQWHTNSAGKVGLMETTSSPNLGAVYALSATQQQAIQIYTPPQTDTPVKGAIVLGEADRLLINHRLARKPLSALKLTSYQVAQLEMGSLGKVLGAGEGVSLQTWYNEQRSHHILDQRTVMANGAVVSPRRYLSDLYQRGFVVHKETGQDGMPHYRMGPIGVELATYTPVPAYLSQQLEKLTVPRMPPGRNAGPRPVRRGGSEHVDTAPIKQGEKSTTSSVMRGAFLIEVGWPVPDAPQSRRMNQLASALDEGQTGELKAAVSNIHQKYPALRATQDTGLLLDALVSQPRSALLRENNSAIAVGSYRMESALDKVDTGPGSQQAQDNQAAFTKHLGPTSRINAITHKEKPVVGHQTALKQSKNSDRKLTPGSGSGI